MLHLRRQLQPFAWERCHISKEYITYGDYYYFDDEDGLIVKASVYNEMKRRKREEEWDYTRLHNALSEREYTEMCREKERQFLTNHLLDRKVDKGAYTPNA